MKEQSDIEAPGGVGARRPGRRRSPSARLLALAGLAMALGTGGVASAQPGGKKKDSADFSKPFSHDTHLKQLTKKGDRAYTCADCHAMATLGKGDTKGDYPICESPRMPFPTHDKCITCHPTAFFVKPLRICTNCHTDIAITQKVDLKEQNTAQAPLRTVFDHQLHLNPKQRVKDRFGFSKDCSFCHEFVKGGEKVLLPQHAQCCECHTKADVEPNINDCAGCHQRPASEKNPQSMVRKFSHADHKLDPVSGKSLPCLRCHFDVPKAKTISQLQLPKMETCVECHEGEIAFSYADCLKCHDKGIETRLIPASHKAATQGR